MNENIDLTKILDGCPPGTEFYSLIYGKVRFVKLRNCAYTPILVRDDIDDMLLYFEKDGSIIYGRGECTLFPSKDQRDWSKFVRFWDNSKVEKFDVNTLKPYNRVLVRDATSRCWKIDFYGYNPDPYVGLIECASGSKPYCIPYNEETKHLLGTNDDCPEYYRWWEE